MTGSELPPDLTDALEIELGRIPGREIAAATRTMSARYRERHSRSRQRVVITRVDAAAYAAYRLPATFAAVRATLCELRDARPDLRPTTLLDAGAGPGTGGWAAVDVWPEIERITLLEADARMMELGKTLVRHARSPALRSAEWRSVDLTGPWSAVRADISLAAYVLGELPADARPALAARMWDHSLQACVVVEPGTPRGYELVREVTSVLDRAGACILAPFPAGWNCLEGPDDWCHFAQRVPRTRIHRRAKGAALSYEDEKYSYVVASREPGREIGGRVVRAPEVRPGHVRLAICTKNGVRRLVVARSDRLVYRRARDLKWGSALSHDEVAAFGLS